MADEQFKGIFYNNGNFSNVQDILAVEVSLTIAINGVPFTVTMRTPGFELELIRGLLYSEEVFRDLEIEPEVEILTTNAKGYVTSVNIKLPDSKKLLLKLFTI